jgi:hypothetical protein
MDRLGAVVPDGTNWRGSVARIAEEVLSSRGVDFALAVPARGWTNATWLAGDLVVRVAPSAGPADLLREAGLAACLPVQVGYPDIIDAGVLDGHEWVLTRRILGQSLSDVWSTLDWNQRASAIEQIWAKAEYAHRLDVSAAAPYVRPRSKDIDALIGVLDPDATAIADGGGLVSAELRPIEGGEQIARVCVDIASWVPNLALLERTVNGQPGLVAQQDGITVTVYAFDIAGDRIQHIWAVRNPEKLRPWTAG